MLETVATGSSPVSVPTVRGSYATAFIDRNQHLVYVDGVGRATDTGVIAASGVSPALALDFNDSPTVAVESSTGTLVVWRFSGTTRTGFATRAQTIPSISLDSNGGYHVAYVGPTGSVSVATPAGTVDTGLRVLPGANASIAVLGTNSALVYATTTSGLLQSAREISPNSYSADAPLPITAAPSTTPAIAAFGPSGYELAYVNAQGQLKLFGALGSLASTVSSPKLVSSPSLSVRGDGMVTVAALASDGHPWRFTKSSASRSPIAVASMSVPSILLLR
jgi:hypothetical protein